MKEAEIVQELFVFDLDDKIPDHEDCNDATTTNTVPGIEEQNCADGELIVDRGKSYDVIENELGMQESKNMHK